MIGVKMEATGPESIARTAYLRMALTEIEKAALAEAKTRIAQFMQAGESPEVQWQNQGVAMALNVICDMENGK
jgi:hypothetical protein